MRPSSQRRSPDTDTTWTRVWLFFFFLDVFLGRAFFLSLFTSAHFSLLPSTMLLSASIYTLRPVPSCTQALRAAVRHASTVSSPYSRHFLGMTNNSRMVSRWTMLGHHHSRFISSSTHRMSRAVHCQSLRLNGVLVPGPTTDKARLSFSSLVRVIVQKSFLLRNEPSFLSKALVATGAATTFVLAPLLWARALGFSRNVAYCAAATDATPTPAPTPASGTCAAFFLVWLFCGKSPGRYLLIMFFFGCLCILIQTTSTRPLPTAPVSSLHPPLLFRSKGYVLLAAYRMDTFAQCFCLSAFGSAS